MEESESGEDDDEFNLAEIDNELIRPMMKKFEMCGSIPKTCPEDRQFIHGEL